MPDDNVLNIKVSADVSSLTSGFSQAASNAEDFNSRLKAALADLAAATKEGAAAQQVFNKAFDEAQQAGANYLQSLEAGSAAYKQFSQAAQKALTANTSQASTLSEESSEVSETAAAYRQLAAATLEVAQARKLLNAAVKSYAGSQDERAVAVVAAVQEQALAATEQLALAKANLADVQSSSAASAAAEAEAMNADAGAEGAAASGAAAVTEALQKLTAQSVAARDSLASLGIGGALDEDASQISDLTAAYSQLAEATLEVTAAKQELNAVLQENAGKTDAASIAETIAAQRRATEATEQLTLAKRNLAEVEEYVATAAAQESAALGDTATAETTLAAATTEATAAAERQGSESMAAYGAVRVLEGSVMGASGAAGSFLTTTLGLGPVLQAAFPIIGAVALIEVLSDLGTKLYETYEKATQAGQAIKNAFDVSNDKIRATANEIELTNSKLQDEIDKLEHHPGNGLETALLQAKVAADKLQESIDADNESLNALLSKHEIGIFAGLLSGTSVTSGLDKDLKAQSDSIDEQARIITRKYDEALATTKGDQAKIEAAHQKYFNDIVMLYKDAATNLQPSLDHYYDLQRKNNEAKNASTQPMVGMGGIPVSQATPDIDYSPAINTLEGRIEHYKEVEAAAAASMATEPLQARKDKDLQAKEAASEAKTAEAQHLRDLEAAFAQEELLYGKSANQTAAYWSQYLNDSRLGEEQLNEVYQKVIAARAETGKKQPEGEVDKALKKQVTEAKKDAKEYQEALNEMAKARTDLFKETEQQPMLASLGAAHQQATYALQESQAQTQARDALGLGGGGQKQLADLRAIHQEMLDEDQRFVLDQIAILDAGNPQMVAAMRSLQDKLTQAEKTGDEVRIRSAQEALNREVEMMAVASAQEEKQIQELENKLTEIEHQGNMKRIQDAQQAAQQQERIFKKVYDLITNDFNRAFEQWQTKEQTAAQAFSKMLLSMETGIENLVLQYLEKKLFTALMQLLGITNSANGAASGNQQALSTDRTVNPQIVESNAAAAASVTFLTSGGDIAAALATFAEGMAFFPLASFEHGGVVSGMSGMPVPITAHAGERVLSSMQTQNFERLVNTPAAGRGNTVNLHYNPQVNAMDSKHVNSILRAGKDTVLDMVREGINRGALSR